MFTIEEGSFVFTQKRIFMSSEFYRGLFSSHIRYGKEIELIELFKHNGTNPIPNPNKFTFNPMVNPLFRTFCALISSNFLSHSLYEQHAQMLCLL